MRGTSKYDGDENGSIENTMIPINVMNTSILNTYRTKAMTQAFLSCAILSFRDRSRRRNHQSKTFLRVMPDLVHGGSPRLQVNLAEENHSCCGKKRKEKKKKPPAIMWQSILLTYIVLLRRGIRLIKGWTGGGLL